MNLEKMVAISIIFPWSIGVNFVFLSNSVFAKSVWERHNGEKNDAAYKLMSTFKNALDQVVPTPADRLEVDEESSKYQIDRTRVVIDRKTIERNGSDVKFRAYSKPYFEFQLEENQKKKPMTVFVIQNMTAHCEKGDLIRNNSVMFFSNGKSQTITQKDVYFRDLGRDSSQKIYGLACKDYHAQARAQKETQEQAEERANEMQAAAFRRRLKRGDTVVNSRFDDAACNGLVTSVSPPLAEVEWSMRYDGMPYTNRKTEHIKNLYPCR